MTYKIEGEDAQKKKEEEERLKKKQTVGHAMAHRIKKKKKISNTIERIRGKRTAKDK